MENSKPNMVFLAIGIITVLSGIYLIVHEDYVIGVSGSIVGLFLTYQNMKTSEDKNSE